MADGEVWSTTLQAARPMSFPRDISTHSLATLGDVVAATGPVADSFYLSQDSLERWQYLKGAKRAPRTKLDGYRLVR